ncbi:TIGR03619 family F420-dependent LLM class oxidoreductase [Streptosporangium lutulentum]
MVEQRGHSMLLFAEHTHIQAGAPLMREGHPLPRKYWHTYDPLVSCTAAGLATTRLRVGTGICLIPQHHPISLAKSVASVDALTGGRFEFGVGAGWNEPEIRNHGVDPARRFALMKEYVEAMQQIWTREEAEYHGEFVSFDPLWSWPKPRSDRTLRCWSAAWGPRCSTACWPTATAGCRRTDPASWSGCRSCSGAPRRRGSGCGW